MWSVMLLGGAGSLSKSVTYQRNRNQPNQREEQTVKTTHKRQKTRIYRSSVELEFRMKVLLIFTLYLVSGQMFYFV